MLVAFAAGGSADTITRLIAQKLIETTGQNVVVENRSGAGGNIAAKIVVGAAPDGYSLLATTTALAINETLYKSKGYSADDLRPIAIVASQPELISTHPSNPAANLREFVEAQQGKPVTYGSAGVGTGSYVAAEYFFKVLVKLPTVHVPFPGGAPAVTAAIGNHIPLLATSMSGAVEPVRGNQLKGLGIASKARVSVIPNVPTHAESGFGDFQAASWVGFFAPAKIGDEAAARLNAAIDAIVRRPEVVTRLRSVGFEPVTGDLKQVDALFKAERDSWGRMVASAGLTGN